MRLTLPRMSISSVARAAVLSVGLALPCGPAIPEAQLPGLPSVLSELRKGGLVIYLRHAATDTTQNDVGTDLADCATQRNLSEAGREQSREIGKAFRRLDIPVGTVLSSPFCRTRETAELAFGKITVDEDLYFAMSAPREAVARFTESLRRMLSTRPTDGTNTVVVSHTANLREAAGIWPKPEGVAIVFRPLGDGRFEAIARIEPESWAELTS